MNPIAFSVFSLNITWYGISYFVSFIIINFLVVRKLSYKYSKKSIEEIISFAFLGMIVGGRLGYLVLYAPENLFRIEAISIWNGGMAAYGGFIGGAIFLYLKARLRKVAIRDLLDSIALYLPIGLFFGRIANYINDEIPGRVLFGVEHPVILYSIFFEGIFLYLLINFKNYFTKLQIISESALFLISYGSLRLLLDFFRMTESAMLFSFTYGQVFGVIMMSIGLFFAMHKRLIR